MPETTDIPEAKTCTSCGKAFGCGAHLDSCWCAELTLPENAALEIKEKFVDCLCPECLRIFTVAESSKNAV